MVAVNSVQTKRCKELLKGTDVHVGAAISFPLGQTTIETKVFETKDAIANGASEIDTLPRGNLFFDAITQLCIIVDL